MAGAGPPAKSRILVVDDREVNRQLLATLLSYSGYAVHQASGAQEALGMMRELRPDLIISDILMPGMDGYEFVRLVRADPGVAATPVIFQTAHYNESEARGLAEACGVRRILHKSSPVEDLLHAVHEELRVVPPAPPTSPPESEAFGREHLRVITDKLVRKADETRLLNRCLSDLTEMGLDLASRHEPRVILEHACGRGREILNARCAALVTIESPGDSAAIRDVVVCDGAGAGSTIRDLDESVRAVLRSLLAGGRSRRATGQEAARASGLFSRASHPLGALLSVPLLSPAGRIGLFCLGREAGEEGFTAPEERLAATVAAQTAMAYESATQRARLEREVFERRRAESALHAHVEELDRANAELRQFAFVASHDLKEPLRMMASYADLVAKRYRGALDADADTFLGYMVEGAHRMRALLEGLLRYSRAGGESTAERPTSAQEALRGALSSLRLSVEEAGAVVTHDALPEVWIAPEHLEQLFQNIVGNAIKFRGSEPPRVHVSARVEGREAAFRVTDNGIGVAPEHAAKVFELFQRLNAREAYEGQGLGLAICRRIVTRYGGRIWIESEPGRGASVHFTLPTEMMQERSAPASAAASALRPGAG